MPAVQERYSAVAITLHWLIALGIIVNIALGLYFTDLPRSDANDSSSRRPTNRLASRFSC